MKTQKKIFITIVIFIILLSGCDNWMENLSPKSAAAAAAAPEFWEKMAVPENTNVVFSNCTKGLYFAGTNDGKILYSTDFGQSWTLAYETGSAISIIGSNRCGDAPYYLVGNNKGIYLSLGGQNNWSATLLFSDQDRPTKINSIDGLVVYGKFGKDNTYYYTGNNSWSKYARNDTNSEIKSCFESLFCNYYAMKVKTNGQIYRFWSPDNKYPDIIILGDDVDIYNLIYDSNISRFFAPTSKGLFTSDDLGKTWAITDFSGIDVKNIIIYKNYYYVGTENGIFTSIDKGKTWRSFIGPYQGYSIKSFNMTSDSVIYLQTVKNEFFLHRINNNNSGFFFINLVPILLFPENGSIGIDQTVNFKWSDQKEYTQVWYFFQVSKDSNFSKDILANIEWLSQPFYSLSGLSEQTKYYWRVRRGNADTMSLWSDIWSFTTK